MSSNEATNRNDMGKQGNKEEKSGTEMNARAYSKICWQQTNERV